MRTLSLFSGIGGLDLGVHAALRCLGLEPRSVGYAEREAFAQAVLVAWMEDEGLGPAPIIEDVSDPILGECPADLVVAGFPCQPASVAGNRAGTADERWLWPLVAGCVRQVGPQLVFLENVPGLLTVNGGRAFAEVLGDLADLGFDAEWTVLGAHAVGAPHRRERLFLLAWRQLAHGHREPRPLNSPIARSAGSGNGSKPRVRGAGIWPPGPNDAAGWRQWLEAGGPPPAIEPGVRGVPDGPAGGMVESLAWRADRLRALGNAVVPAQAEAAFLMLWERAGLRMTRGTG